MLYEVITRSQFYGLVQLDGHQDLPAAQAQLHDFPLGDTADGHRIASRKGADVVEVDFVPYDFAAVLIAFDPNDAPRQKRNRESYNFV